jgi:hypothetical protein
MSEEKTVQLVPFEELADVARACRKLCTLLAPYMLRVRAVMPADRDYHDVAAAIAELNEQARKVIDRKTAAQRPSLTGF